MKLVRFPLPQDVFVRLVKPHAPARRKLEQVAFLNSLKRRMLLEEIGDTIADSGSVHRCSLVVESSALSLVRLETKSPGEILEM